MDRAEITIRVNRAIRIWSDMPNAEVMSTDPLDDFRTDHRDELRVRVNEEFEGEKGFPIEPGDWTDLNPQVVGDIEDEADKRINGDES